MNKRGQITLFIIVGIVLVALIALILMIRNVPIEAKLDEEIKASVGTPMQPVRVFTDSCIKKVAEGALVLIGMQGGYIWFPDDIEYLETLAGPMAFWYDGYREEGDRDIAPSKEDIEAEIDKYVEEFLSNCIDDFKDFNKDITAGEIIADTEIFDSSTIINVKYPITLKEGENQYKTSLFRVEIPVRLGKVLEDAKSIVDMEVILDKQADLTYLAGLQLDNRMYKYQDDILIYGIEDELSLIDNTAYVFAFANRFKIEEEAINHAPKITNAKNLSGRVGQTITYDFDAVDEDGDKLTFSIISVVGSIDPDTGLFSYEATEIRDDYFDVEVQDEEGLSDIVTIKITVS